MTTTNATKSAKRLTRSPPPTEPGPSLTASGRKEEPQVLARFGCSNLSKVPATSNAPAPVIVIDISAVVLGIPQALECLSECFDQMRGQSASLAHLAPVCKSRTKRPISSVESSSDSGEEVQRHSPGTKKCTNSYLNCLTLAGSVRPLVM